jgi:hypothetical protein
MRPSDSGPNGRRERLSGPSGPQSPSWLPAAMLTAGLTLGVFAQGARAQEDEIPFSAVRIILETNATDCDTGLQLFFDGDPWNEVKVEDPNGTTILHVRALGPLREFGAVEQFNETNEPVMAELVEGFPELECAEPEFTLMELFELFPEGIYEFEGRTVEGGKLEGEATLSHVIPAPPEIVAPVEEDSLQDPNNTVIRWDKVEKPILAKLGPVEIVGFHVVVVREAGGGTPAPLVVFTADLSADTTQVNVPSQFLEEEASYTFEVLQIERSGNQTIAEGAFQTR